VVVKQVDEAAKAFRGPWIGAGPVQQGYQLVVDMGTTWVGPCQHAANEGRLGQKSKQGHDHPALPVRMIWGEADPWEDPAEARRWAEQYSCIQDLRVLPGLGHCPHDEAPELVNSILLEWVGAGPTQRT
jgi:pimeloyl-ACP methyl ester carboxylesterase